MNGLLVAALVAAALVAAPLVSVALSVLAGGTSGTWAHLSSTVLPDYVLSTLLLCATVGIGVAALGVGAAWLVTRHEFTGRASFEWLLVLPLAMPAYVIAYAYTDWLQYVGPLQSGLRRVFGWSRADYWFPDVRSLGGAALMFTLVLYPYVYLLARTAFLARAGGMIEVGR
ncbi:MAG: iron ABC transporter permease, partial [Rhizobacter sp.]